MVEITNGEEITIELGETLQLTAEHNFVSESTYTWYAMNSCVKIEEDGLITGINSLIDKAIKTITRTIK